MLQYANQKNKNAKNTQLKKKENAKINLLSKKDQKNNENWSLN